MAITSKFKEEDVKIRLKLLEKLKIEFLLQENPDQEVSPTKTLRVCNDVPPAPWR